MSADSLMDKKKCEILVTKVERKDLGKWRLKEKYYITRSLGALRAPTSRLRPFGPALGTSGLLDNVLHALRALRPCDTCISAIKKCFWDSDDEYHKFH